jgi:hypothetical protein
LEVVNESGAGVESESGIARSVEFDGAAKVESIAPSAVVGGTAWNKRLVVVNEAVAEIEKQAPSAESRSKLETDEAFLRRTVLAVGAGTREETCDGIEVGVLRKTIIETKAVAGNELFAVGAGFPVQREIHRDELDTEAVARLVLPERTFGGMKRATKGLREGTFRGITEPGHLAGKHIGESMAGSERATKNFVLERGTAFGDAVDKFTLDGILKNDPA